MNERKLRQLTELSKEARQLLTKMIGQIGVGHVGGSLSLIEALVYLYYEEMRVRPEEPGWPDRDRIVLSKGHAGPALYTLLAMKGYFDKEILLTLNQPGTRLPSHCDMKLTTGIDMTAGSLGQGLSAAVQASKFSEEKWPLAFELLNNCGGDNHEGFIGLQDHGDDVWFRNIRVKVLD